MSLKKKSERKSHLELGFSILYQFLLNKIYPENLNLADIQETGGAGTRRLLRYAGPLKQAGPL